MILGFDAGSEVLDVACAVLAACVLPNAPVMNVVFVALEALATDAFRVGRVAVRTA
jgi:hypothetical protein